MDAHDKAAFIIGAARALQESGAGWAERVRDVTGAKFVPDVNVQDVPLDIFEALWPRMVGFEVRGEAMHERASGWLGEPSNQRAIYLASAAWPNTNNDHADWRVRSGLRTVAEVEAEDAIRRDLQKEI